MVKKVDRSEQAHTTHLSRCMATVENTADTSAPEEGDRAMRRFSCLARSASCIASADTLKHALAAIVDAVLDGLGWDTASVYLRDGNGNLTAQDLDSPAAALQSNASLIQQVLTSEAPLLLETLSIADAEALGMAGDSFVRAAVAPIRAHGETLGILVTATRGSPPPQPDDALFLAAVAAQAGDAMAYHALWGLHERMRTELEAAHQVSLRASASLDVGEALDSALAAVQRVLGVAACAIYEAADQGRLRCTASRNLPQALIQTFEEYSAHGPAHTAMATGIAAIFNAPEDYSGAPQVVQTALAMNVQSALVLPVYVSGEPYGVLSLYDSKPRAWSESDIRVGQLLANTIAGALSRARSYANIVQSAAHLRELHLVSVRLLESGEPERVALVATECGRGLLKADVVAIQAYDRRYQMLKLISAHPPDTECVPVVVPVGRGVSGKAVAEMRTIVRPLRLARAAFNGFVVAVPLKSQDEVIGVLTAFRSGEKGAFHPEEIEFVELLAAIVATAMHNAQLTGRSEELGILTERTRIATEMHDSVGDNLAALLMKAELAQSVLDSDTERARRELNWITTTLQQSIIEMRRILRALRPVELEQMGLLAAIRKIADDYTHNCGIVITLRTGDGMPNLGRRAEYALYRAVNECLNNVRKYAGATSVTLSFRTDSRQFRLTLEDNGRGFDPAGDTQSHGMGLHGLRESIHAAGGELEIASTPGMGTCVTVSFPIQGAA
jgi:signal transduction histidine kinase